MEDKDLLKIAHGFRKGLLQNLRSKEMCFAVCAPLQGLLSAIYKLDTELVEGTLTHMNGQLAERWQHYWLKLPDGRILAPTADQFKDPNGDPMPAVYLGEKPYWY